MHSKVLEIKGFLMQQLRKCAQCKFGIGEKGNLFITVVDFWVINSKIEFSNGKRA